MTSLTFLWDFASNSLKSALPVTWFCALGGPTKYRVCERYNIQRGAISSEPKAAPVYYNMFELELSLQGNTDIISLIPF